MSLREEQARSIPHFLALKSGKQISRSEIHIAVLSLTCLGACSAFSYLEIRVGLGALSYLYFASLGDALNAERFIESQNDHSQVFKCPCVLRAYLGTQC